MQVEGETAFISSRELGFVSNGGLAKRSYGRTYKLTELDQAKQDGHDLSKIEVGRMIELQ